jgi:hypothetical protein
MNCEKSLRSLIVLPQMGHLGNSVELFKNINIFDEIYLAFNVLIFLNTSGKYFSNALAGCLCVKQRLTISFSFCLSINLLYFK